MAMAMPMRLAGQALLRPSLRRRLRLAHGNVDTPMMGTKSAREVARITQIRKEKLALATGLFAFSTSVHGVVVDRCHYDIVSFIY